LHIPDGFLTNRIALSFNALSVAGIVYAARRLDLHSSGRMIPTMGVLSAFVFAAQMINFPVLGGTSGHLVGGALLAVLLGPMAGFLAMASVVVAQALFLQDGGLVALGANLFSIGAVPCWSGYVAYRLLAGRGRARKRIAMAGFAAGWISLVLSALSCAFLLSASGVIPLRIGLPAMAGYHAVIGLAEGALTAGVLSFLYRVRPDLLDQGGALRGFADWAWALIFALIPFAVLAVAGTSELPDPLQRLLDSPTNQAALSERLLSAERLQGYIGVGAALILVIMLAYLAHRIIQDSKRPHH